MTTRDACTGTLLPGATVALSQSGHSDSGTTADPDDRVCLAAVAGSYTITASYPGYTTTTLTGTFACPPPTTGASYGTKYPATWSSDPSYGAVAWQSPGNAAAADSSYAVGFSTAAVPTQYLVGVGLDFSAAPIPSTDAVVGVLVEVTCSADFAATDDRCRLVVGGSIGATDRATGAALSTSGLAVLSYGGATDLWGYAAGALAVSDVTGPGFGAAWGAKSAGTGAASTNGGAFYPTTWADGGGSHAWTNPSNAGASDSTFATATTGSGAATNLLQGTNPTPFVPAGARVDGIKVEVRRKASATGAVDDTVKLILGGSVGATNRSAGAAIATTAATVTFGGATDLWGLSGLDAADVNATNFGACYAASKSTAGNVTVSVDFVRVTIWYTTRTRVSVDSARLTVYTSRTTYELTASMPLCTSSLAGGVGTPAATLTLSTPAGTVTLSPISLSDGTHWQGSQVFTKAQGCSQVSGTYHFHWDLSPCQLLVASYAYVACDVALYGIARALYDLGSQFPEPAHVVVAIPCPRTSLACPPSYLWQGTISDPLGYFPELDGSLSITA